MFLLRDINHSKIIIIEYHIIDSHHQLNEYLILLHLLIKNKPLILFHPLIKNEFLIVHPLIKNESLIVHRLIKNESLIIVNSLIKNEYLILIQDKLHLLNEFNKLDSILPQNESPM